MRSEIFPSQSTPRQVNNQENQTTAQKRANDLVSRRIPLADRTPRPQRELLPNIRDGGNDRRSGRRPLADQTPVPQRELFPDYRDGGTFKFSYDLDEHIKLPILIRNKNEEVKFVQKYRKDPVRYSMEAPQYGDMFMVPEKDTMPSYLTIEEPNFPIYIDYI